MTDLELPYEPKSRQQQGRDVEKVMAKERGARPHPMSGAGRIKDDASSEDAVFEFKLAKASHTLKASDLKALFIRATRQGKQPFYVIQFDDLVATVHIERTWKHEW